MCIRGHGGPEHNNISLCTQFLPQIPIPTESAEWFSDECVERDRDATSLFYCNCKRFLQTMHDKSHNRHRSTLSYCDSLIADVNPCNNKQSINFNVHRHVVSISFLVAVHSTNDAFACFYQQPSRPIEVVSPPWQGLFPHWYH